jgi:hypothetical protein
MRRCKSDQNARISQVAERRKLTHSSRTLFRRVFWVPLVTDDTRKGFEAFANANKGQLLESFLLENGLRAKQDARYGLGGADHGADHDHHDRALQDDPYADYHPQIFGLTGDDEPQPEGSGILCKCISIMQLYLTCTTKSISHFCFPDVILSTCLAVIASSSSGQYIEL